MRVLERGHVYQLAQLDEHTEMDTKPVVLRFVNREPGTEHPGTQTQEVLRALIDRTLHCEARLSHPLNNQVVYHLRMALAHLEARALIRKVEKGYLKIEEKPTGTDGHLMFLDSKEATP